MKKTACISLHGLSNSLGLSVIKSYFYFQFRGMSGNIFDQINIKWNLVMQWFVRFLSSDDKKCRRF